MVYVCPLALRIATQTPLEILESFDIENDMEPSKHEGFQSPYHQFMHLSIAPCDNALRDICPIFTLFLPQTENLLSNYRF